MIKKALRFVRKYVLYIALVQALSAFLGSLYFSEIQHFIPCTLCWYQRILMYPLIPILVVGIMKKDKDLPYYALPLSVVGSIIGIYQVLLERGILPEIATCSVTVPCNTIYINWFGFITIPLLSLVAFLIITVCVLVYRSNVAVR